MLQAAPNEHTKDLKTVFRNGTDASAALVAAKSNTVGANKSAFTGWTWADVAGQLNDFK
jgi:hypothetical protein